MAEYSTDGVVITWEDYWRPYILWAVDQNPSMADFFNHFDTDHDGRVSKEDCDAQCPVGWERMHGEELQDENGIVTWHAFCDHAGRENGLDVHRGDEFAHHDHDQDGVISRSDICFWLWHDNWAWSLSAAGLATYGDGHDFPAVCHA